MTSAVHTESLTKTFPAGRGQPPVAAVDGVDLDVPAGSVRGLLGHNGAGKSTMIKILATLTTADSGTARIAGHDVRTDGHRVRQRIGLVGQHAAVDEILTCRQNLVLFGRLRGLDRTAAGRRADELLEQFDLVDATKRPAAKLSGGMRRRLDLAVSLITTPDVLFVDEPTTGLDPAARRDVWQAITGLARSGTTVLLTTQYLEEADQLADTITILDHGRIAAEGTPAELKARLGGDQVEIAFTGEAVRTGAAAALRTAGFEVFESGTPEDGLLAVPVVDATSGLMAICSALDRADLEPTSLTLRQPTLDDVFLHLTNGATR
ncbi:ATP-binding cassette domain-containing protein [Microlunatus sp. Y2014]|uniref:ATP-binding cassette domain-containing protein n=1 Tax=Microlunatus sp. Y2014 TaxID=3418488 RepID=UPI003DA7581C